MDDGLEKTILKTETKNEKTTDRAFRKMSRDIKLTITTLCAFAYTSCDTPSDNGWGTGSDGNTYKEVKADSIVHRSGSTFFYYGGRPYMYGSAHTDGTVFHPSESGKGGYFTKPGVSVTSHPNAVRSNNITRGGFGTTGKGFGTSGGG